MHIDVYTHVCTPIHVCASVCVCIYIYIYIYIYICTHTHLHTYICGKMSYIWPGYQISNVRKSR